MKKITDLSSVKAMARMFVMLEVHQTEFSPIVVKHPFTDSGILAYKNGSGDIVQADITADRQAWCVLNSACFGVPQQRRRVYIVGYLDSRLSGKIFPIEQGDAPTLVEIIPGGQGQRVYSPEGASTTLTSSGGGWGAKTGLYFVDMNPNPVVTHEARCITARQDSGISNRKGVDWYGFA